MQKNRSMKSLESDINIFELIQAELSNLHWILFVAILLGGTMFMYSSQKVKAQYLAESSISVETQIKDISVFSQLIYSDEFLKQVVTSLNLDESVELLRSRITVTPLLASSDLDTTYFKVQVVWSDETLILKIGDRINQSFIQRAPNLLPITESFILGSKVDMILNPNNIILQRTIIGGILGAVIAAGFVLISYLFDFRIRSMNELVEFSSIPVVANISDKK